MVGGDVSCRRAVADGHIHGLAAAAACAFEHHLAPAGVAGGEGEDGLGLEGGHRGVVGGDVGVGLLDGAVAVGVGVLVEAHEVGGVAGGSQDGHRGAVVDDEGVEGVVSGNHALGEDSGRVAVGIEDLVARVEVVAGYGILSNVVRADVVSVIEFGEDGAAVGGHNAVEDDVVALDAALPVLDLVLRQGGEVGRHVLVHNPGVDTLPGADVEGAGSEAAGRVAGEAHLAALVAGESQRRLVVEVGCGGGVGDDVGVGLRDGAVAVGVGVVVEVHEVVSSVGRGFDGDAGAVVYIICIRLGGGSNGVFDGDAGGEVRRLDVTGTVDDTLLERPT